MRYLSTLIAALLVSIMTMGQTPAFVAGSTIKGSPLSNGISFLSKEGDGFSVLRYGEFSDTKYYLESFDNAAQLTSSHEVKPPQVNGQSLYIEHAFVQDGKKLLLGSATDTKAGMKVYYLARLSAEGNIEGTPKKLFEVPKKMGIFFTLKASPSGSKVALLYANQDDKAKLTTVYLEVLGGADLQKSYTVTYPYVENDMGLFVFDHNVSDAGNVYMLGRYIETVSNEDRLTIFNKIVSPRKGLAGGFLLTAEAGSNKFRENKIDIGDNIISDLKLSLTPGQRPFVAGLYSRYAGNTAMGVFYAALKENESHLLPSYIPFDEKILGQFIDLNSTPAAKDRELQSFFIRHILFGSDGSLYFTMECVTHTIIRPEQGSNYTAYFYGDILALKVNGNKIEWGTRVAKFQEDFVSFATVLKGSTLYIFYNDNKNNLSITDPAKVKTLLGLKNSAQLLAVKLDNGTPVKLPLADGKELGAIPNLLNPLYTDEKEMILEGHDRAKVALGKIKL